MEGRGSDSHVSYDLKQEKSKRTTIAVLLLSYGYICNIQGRNGNSLRQNRSLLLTSDHTRVYYPAYFFGLQVHVKADAPSSFFIAPPATSPYP